LDKIKNTKEETTNGFNSVDNEFIEFETKYRISGDMVYKFKEIVGSHPEIEDFLYVEGDDIYYTKEDEFLRYRMPPKKNKRAELTYKTKHGAKNNVARTEVNLRVDSNDHSTVEKFVNILGFKYNFRITKICHIYYTKEANLVFYSIIDHTDSNKKMEHFVEIEVNEELSSTLTEQENWAIIKRWENIMAPIGIIAQKRLSKSLFEMYKK
jgi:predicted adenylyl cyclase CyaB